MVVSSWNFDTFSKIKSNQIRQSQLQTDRKFHMACRMLHVVHFVNTMTFDFPSMFLEMKLFLQ